MASHGNKIQTLSSVRSPNNFQGTGRTLGEPTSSKSAEATDRRTTERPRAKISMKIGKITRRGNDLGGVGAVGAISDFGGALVIGNVDPNILKSIYQSRPSTKPSSRQFDLDVEINEVEMDGDAVNSFAPTGGSHSFRDGVIIAKGE